MGEKGEILLVPHVGNGSKNSKGWSSSLSLSHSELEEYTWSLRYWIWVANLGVKTEVIQACSNHRDKSVLYHFHLLDMSFILFVPLHTQGA
jgi:hypothetical protein